MRHPAQHDASIVFRPPPEHPLAYRNAPSLPPLCAPHSNIRSLIRIPTHTSRRCRTPPQPPLPHSPPVPHPCRPHALEHPFAIRPHLPLAPPTASPHPPPNHLPRCPLPEQTFPPPMPRRFLRMGTGTANHLLHQTGNSSGYRSFVRFVVFLFVWPILPRFPRRTPRILKDVWVSPHFCRQYPS